MRCKSCGMEFAVHTRLPNGVYRCPNPDCPSPYISEQGELSNAKLAVIFLFIMGTILCCFVFWNLLTHSSTKESVPDRSSPATFAYYENTAQADTNKYIY
ncbi:MAG: hypothetical protein MJ120_01225 [Clostridia bacterium]|nr:hypothetical protein [Clostridia bacterium]